ncbi:MAG: peptidylprolyl isomerase [Candidatus Methylomirabilia bacterium]
MGFAGAADAQWLFRAEGLEVSDRSLIFALQVKGRKLAGQDRADAVRERAGRLRSRLLLAAAAKRRGYAADAEVVVPLEEYRMTHLADLYVENTIDRPAREKADGSRARYARERDRLFREATARAQKEYPVAVDEKVLLEAFQGAGGDVVVARVAGGEIRAAEVLRGLRQIDHPSDKTQTNERLARTVLESIAVSRGLAALAAREGFAAREDFRDDLASRQISLLADRFIARDIAPEITLTREGVQEYYTRNAERLRRGEEREIQEILLPDQATAEAVAARLKAGAAFADEVLKSSTGATKSAGGFVGFFAAREGHPDLVDAIGALREGEISQPLRTRFGWHILRCVRIVTGRIPPLDEVGPALEEALRRELQEKATAESVVRLEIDTPVETNEARFQQITRGSEK